MVCSTVNFTFTTTGCTKILVVQRPECVHIVGIGKFKKGEDVENV